MEVFVAFGDLTEQKIVASFSCAQDSEAWPYQGLVNEEDWRWLSYTQQFNGYLQ